MFVPLPQSIIQIDTFTAPLVTKVILWKAPNITECSGHLPVLGYFNADIPRSWI